MSDELNIALGIIMTALVANSWYIHYRVKDGVARVILLWFNAILFGLFFLRTVGYIFNELGYLNIYTSRIWNQYVFILLYCIPLIQQWLQRVPNHIEESKLRRKGDKK